MPLTPPKCLQTSDKGWQLLRLWTPQFARNPANHLQDIVTGRIEPGQAINAKMVGSQGMVHAQLKLDAGRNLLYFDGHDTVGVTKTR